MGRGSSKGSGGGGSSKNVKQDKLTTAAKSGTIDDKYKNLQTFDDKAAGTHQYGGNGLQTRDFFEKNSNFDSLIDQMDRSERTHFHSWSSGHFMLGQQYKGWDGMTDHDKRLTKTYDKFLDQATLTKGVVVTRLTDAQVILGAGKRKATLAQLQAMEGRSIISRGNMSFAAAGEGLTIGQKGKKCRA